MADANMKRVAKSISHRLLPSLCALAAFIAMTLLYLFGSQELYISILQNYGLFEPGRIPFLDFQNSLAAWECTRQGFDVIQTNPCDVLNRPYNYGPWWMAFSFIPLKGDDNTWVSWILAFCFLVSLSFLPPAKGRWGLTVTIAATLSTTVVFAVERANIDIIIFILLVAAGNLALGRPVARYLGYGLIAFAAAFKYYPITALIVTLRERTLAFLVTTLAVAFLVVLFVIGYWDDLQRAQHLIPNGSYFSDAFSANNFPYGTLQIVPLLRPGGSLDAALVIYAVSVVQALCWVLILRKHLTGMVLLLDARETVFLAMGCALIVGCFFAGENVGYRGIMMLFALPGLLALAQNARTRTQSRITFLTCGAIVFLMWGECFRLLLHSIADGFMLSDSVTFAPYVIFWVTREFTWWWVIAVLSTILIEFAVRSEAVMGLVLKAFSSAKA